MKNNTALLISVNLATQSLRKTKIYIKYPVSNHEWQNTVSLKYSQQRLHDALQKIFMNLLSLSHSPILAQ